MKYITVQWPDVQQYMAHPFWKEQHYYDPTKDTWLIPENWEDDYYPEYEYGGDIGDLDDALG